MLPVGDLLHRTGHFFAEGVQKFLLAISSWFFIRKHIIFTCLSRLSLPSIPQQYPVSHRFSNICGNEVHLWKSLLSSKSRILVFTTFHGEKSLAELTAFKQEHETFCSFHFGLFCQAFVTPKIMGCSCPTDFRRPVSARSYN